MSEEKQTLDDDAPVPKLPRGKGFALSWPQVMRIGFTLVALVAVVALREPCSDSVGRFVTTFGGEASPAPNAASPAVGTAPTTANPATNPATTNPATANPATNPATSAAPPQAPGAGEPEPEYELMSTSMTDDELRAAFERAKRRAEAAKAKAAEAAAKANPPPAPGAEVAPAPPPTSPAPSAGSPAPQSPPKER